MLHRDSLNAAYKRVKQDGGAAGIDGMTVDEMLPYLKEHKEELLASIRSGRYKPQPVRRVEIPRPDGGIRLLGIPTVIDRWIRRRIRMYLWKQWKKVNARFDNLKRLKIPKGKAWEWANSRKGYWRIAGSWVLTRSLTNESLVSFGYDDISKRYEVLHSNH